MPECVLSVVGLVICWAAAWACRQTVEDTPFRGMLGAMLSCCAAIYFLVRLVHWAWVTPIPIG